MQTEDRVDYLIESLSRELAALDQQGLRKIEPVLTGPQSARPSVLSGSSKQLNFCANNYLGLSNHPDVVGAAANALESHGLGLASVRFICGTSDLHIDLEQTVSEFLSTEATILYSSCFDANGGFFEALFGAEDAIISDRLNHASIIDGIRLSKAKRLTYSSGDIAELETCLRSVSNARRVVVATDGVFSMDGAIAPLREIRDLARRYEALLMVDDSHGIGVIGKTGRGSAEHCGVHGDIDIYTGTFGKALSGGAGGFVSGRQEIIDMLRQRSRPYLFSNTMPPPLVAAAKKALAVLEDQPERLEHLRLMTRSFRLKMTSSGFTLGGDAHPICPIILGEEQAVSAFAQALKEQGILATGFWFPVVPKGAARIRVQISADHTEEDIDRAVNIFRKIGVDQGVLSG